MSHPLSENRNRVTDDALDLATILEIAEPLTQKTMERLTRADNWEVPIVIRKALSRYAILIALRLLENTPPGRTGTTAGILALVDTALSAKLLSQVDHDSIKRKLDELRATMEVDGLSFDDLHLFRNSALAHTLIPHTKLSNDIWAHLVFKHFRKIVSLVSEIDKLFDKNGVEPKSTFAQEVADWDKKSADFWSRAIK